MARFQGKGSTKQVDLAVALYNNAVSRNEQNGITAAFPTTYLHPDSSTAPGQTNLALNTRRDEKSPSGYNNTAAYSSSQMRDIVATAGDNHAPMTNKDGQAVGRIYGVKADVMKASNGSGMVMNTKTLASTELPVGPDAQGRDLVNRVIDTHKAAKEAKEAQGPAPVAQEQEAQAQRPQAAVNEPDFG